MSLNVRSVNATISLSYSFYPLLHSAANNNTCNQALTYSVNMLVMSDGVVSGCRSAMLLSCC